MLRSSLQVFFLTLWVMTAAVPTSATSYLDKYKGKPYQDSQRPSGAQRIPERVECTYYDLGGEGIAYHDTDKKNNGSGTLNPADGSYLNQFRMDEGVDVSYTRFRDQIDNNPYEQIHPEEVSCTSGGPSRVSGSISPSK